MSTEREPCRQLYGIVRADALDAQLHLVRGRAEKTLCAIAKPGTGWAVTMRGLVSADYLLGADCSSAMCPTCSRAAT